VDRQRYPVAGGQDVAITGANSGIGFEAALQLAAKGGMCCSPVAIRTGRSAVEAIKQQQPSASVR
jgi:NAD(P)-dependent dehydrogenase (short-subunit alcohol dehydrogenase family)